MARMTPCMAGLSITYHRGHKTERKGRADRFKRKQYEGVSRVLRRSLALSPGLAEAAGRNLTALF